MESTLRIREFILLCLSVLAAPMYSQELSEDESHPTTLDVMRLLARTISVATVTQSKLEGSTRIHLYVLPRESAWYVESGISEGMKSQGFIVNEDSLSPVAAEFGLRSGSVAYSNLRRSGFLGPKVVDRKVTLTLTTKLVNRSTGTIILQTDVEESMTDTIGVAQIVEVENPAIRMTKGTLPSEGFFSNIAEPVVVIGSIAIAVILLFSVRS